MQTQFDPDDQPRDYLLFLLDHESGCLMENCPLCDRVQRLYDLVQSRFLGSKMRQEDAQKVTMRIQ